MKLHWVDATSYDKSEKIAEREARVWETTINGFKILIHRHVDYPDTWLLTAQAFGIEHMDLLTNTFEVAENKAIDKLVKTLDEYVVVRNELANFKAI